MSGRIAATVGPRVRSIVYGSPTAEQISAELGLMTTVDLAHLVMLAQCGLIKPADAAALAARIRALRADGFRPLHAAPTPRGLYLAYEDYLIAQLGPEVGGRLHTGRSRNDLKATVTALRLRDELTGLVSQLGRLQAVLLGRARAHRDAVMPIHTHFQAAMPVTYGYYLTGVALALSRDILALRQAADSLDRCPLGAGAVAGSDLPIDPRRSAELLGFAGPCPHALDAVASRDGALRAVAAAAGAALAISRLGADLQLWSSVEFGFVSFPDRLVGGSSAMPQKRNAFLLEHVKAKAGAAIGGWTAAAAMTRASVFTNSIEVGTEAVGCVWPALDAVADAAMLAQYLVAGAKPQPARMLERAENGFVGATALADRLVSEGVPFRTAHSLVGAAVRRAVERGATRLEAEDLPARLCDAQLSLADQVARQRAGGGPGDFDSGFQAARAELNGHAGWGAAVRSRQRAADARLAAAVDALLKSTMPANTVIDDTAFDVTAPANAALEEARWFVLLESNTTGSGRQFCAAARELGLRPLLLCAKPERYSYLEADGVEYAVLPTDDLDAVTAHCQALAAGAGLAGVTSSSEYFIGPAAAVAARLGLPGPDATALSRCRDKATQHATLQAARIAVPRSRTVRGADEAVAAARLLGFPVVLKPTTGSGSVGVRLCRDAAEVKEHAAALLSAGVNERGIPVPAAALVQEYVAGPEYSVETFAGEAVAVTAKHLGPAPHFVEIGHDLPAPVSEEGCAQLAATAAAALRALGLGWGAAHTELRMSPHGPVVIEVNPRLAGGMIPTLVRLATGTDLVAAVVARAAALPQVPAATVADPQRSHAAIRFAVGEQPGIVTEVGGLEAARALTGIATAQLTVTPGDRLFATGSFRDRYGYAVATGPDAATAAERAARAAACLFARLNQNSGSCDD